MTTHFGRLFGQIGYILSEVVRFLGSPPPIIPILVAGSCMFVLQSQRKSPCVGTVFSEDEVEEQLQEFYSWLFSNPVGKTGM